MFDQSGTFVPHRHVTSMVNMVPPFCVAVKPSEVLVMEVSGGV